MYLFILTTKKKKKVFISWSGWWNCGPFVPFLILHEKHATHTCYLKEANYGLRVMACDLGAGEGQRERNEAGLGIY